MRNDELIGIITKFAGSGWDVINAPSTAWLNDGENTEELIAAIRQADEACGNCGCEYDALYKRALELLTAR